MNFTKQMSNMVCSKEVSFSINDGIISNVKFKGGCQGNLAAVAKLIDGKGARYVVKVLKGNKCGNRPTSCADCFARFVEEALEEMEHGTGKSL